MSLLVMLLSPMERSLRLPYLKYFPFHLELSSYALHSQRMSGIDPRFPPALPTQGSLKVLREQHDGAKIKLC